MALLFFSSKCLALVLAPSVVFVAFLLLLLRKNLRKDKNYNLPPGPPPLPIIGNLHQLGSLPHHSLWQLSRVHGPVLLVCLGRIPTVILSSAETAREVLKTHDLDTCSRPRTVCTGRLSYNYLDIAFAPYGDYWREMRKLCISELVSTKRVDRFRFVREEEVKDLVERIEESAVSGSTVDLSENMLKLNAGIISRVAFGRSFRGMVSDKGNEFVDIVHEALVEE